MKSFLGTDCIARRSESVQSYRQCYRSPWQQQSQYHSDVNDVTMRVSAYRGTLSKLKFEINLKPVMTVIRGVQRLLRPPSLPPLLPLSH